MNTIKFKVKDLDVMVINSIPVISITSIIQWLDSNNITISDLVINGSVIGVEFADMEKVTLIRFTDVSKHDIVNVKVLFNKCIAKYAYAIPEFIDIHIGVLEHYKHLLLNNK